MESSGITSVQTQLIAHFYEEGRTSFKLLEDTYDSWAMLMCEQGMFEYRIGEESGEVKVGEVVLCPPGQPLFRQVMTTLSFHFTTFHLKAFQHEKEVGFPYFGKLTCRNSMRLRYTMEQMRAAKNNVSIRYSEHLLNDVLYQMIDELAVRRQEKKPDDPIILEAVRHLHEHAYFNITLQEVADHVRLSSSQFTRKFQKVMGISPIKYLTRLRMQKVCSLLIESDHTLEEIAELSGYQNAFYLSRVFSREMGMSPSHYRQLHQV